MEGYAIRFFYYSLSCCLEGGLGELESLVHSLVIRGGSPVKVVSVGKCEELGARRPIARETQGPEMNRIQGVGRWGRQGISQLLTQQH